MNEPTRSPSAERLFPFVLRARILLVGREVLRRSRPKLHFILVTSDLTESSRNEILAKFAPYPIVQHYTSADLDRFFGIKGAKVVGFQKSSLAVSIYAELKPYRINQPLHPSKPAPGAAAVVPEPPAPATNPIAGSPQPEIQPKQPGAPPSRSFRPHRTFSRKPGPRPPYRSNRNTPKDSGR